MRQHYFISFQKRASVGLPWEPGNTVTDLHPMSWLSLAMREHITDEYVITFYEPISKAYYEKLKDRI